MANPETISDLIARRVREVRKDERGLSVADLAARCAEAGMPKLTAQALYRLEQRTPDRPARPVTVDELLVLAYCLDVSPLYLISGLDDDALIPVTPDLSAPATGVRAWIRAMLPLPGMDERRFDSYRPLSERDMRFFWLQAGGPIDAVLARLDEARAAVESLRNEDVVEWEDKD